MPLISIFITKTLRNFAQIKATIFQSRNILQFWTENQFADLLYFFFVSLSLGFGHWAVKKLHLHPCKVSAVQKLLPLDYGKRLGYCEWSENN